MISIQPLARRVEIPAWLLTHIESLPYTFTKPKDIYYYIQYRNIVIGVVGSEEEVYEWFTFDTNTNELNRSDDGFACAEKALLEGLKWGLQ